MARHPNTTLLPHRPPGYRAAVVRAILKRTPWPPESWRKRFKCDRVVCLMPHDMLHSQPGTAAQPTHPRGPGFPHRHTAGRDMHTFDPPSAKGRADSCDPNSTRRIVLRANEVEGERTRKPMAKCRKVAHHTSLPEVACRSILVGLPSCRLCLL